MCFLRFLCRFSFAKNTCLYHFFLRIIFWRFVTLRNYLGFHWGKKMLKILCIQHLQDIWYTFDYVPNDSTKNWEKSKIFLPWFLLTSISSSVTLWLIFWTSKFVWLIMIFLTSRTSSLSLRIFSRTFKVLRNIKLLVR